MACLTPFRGLRFAPAYGPEMPLLVSPPYDIISARDQQRFYRRHANNIIRLELGKTASADTAERNRYSRARRTLNQWMASEVLLKESKPALYIQKTAYLDARGASREFTGLITRVKLEPFSERKIFAHEKTFAGPKIDRLNLLRETGVGFSSIFSLYRDLSGNISRVLTRAMQRAPVYDFNDWSGCRQRLWVITKPAIIADLQKIFQGKKLMIADGHHRYSTALAYQKEFARSGEDGSDSVMMCLTDTHDPGLTVWPVYRLIHGVSKENWRRFWTEIKKNFEIEKVDVSSGLPAVQTRRANEVKTPVIGFLGQERDSACLLKLKSGDFVTRIMDRIASHSRIYGRLDVVVLNLLVLEDLLGIRPGEEPGRLTFSHDLAEVRAAVNQGKVQAAFLPGLPNLKAIWDLARQGEIMPQKSTYFLPKLVTGLVMNPINPEDEG
ncbi:DUF1015 domain-containing protein [bacterium]|nr:DUF1015 domain-containing protein [bacterium]